MTMDNFRVKSINLDRGEVLEELSPDTKILFTLKGKLGLRIQGKEYKLNLGDLVIINRNQSYSLEARVEGSILMDLSISNEYFLSVHDDFLSMKFNCYPDKFSMEKLDGLNQLKSELAQFLVFYLNHSSTKTLNLYIALNKIILTMVSYFKEEADFYSSGSMDGRIVSIIGYLEKNYSQEIKVEDLAKDYFLSSSSLSKLFKSNTGMYFLDYLNGLRVNKSLKELLYGAKNIEEISVSYGFNNSKNYRRWFKRSFHMSPSEYKDSLSRQADLDSRGNFILEEAYAEDILEMLYSYMNKSKESIKPNLPIENYTKILADANTNRRQILPDKIIHIGSLDLLLEKEILSQVNYSLEDVGIDYIGISRIYEIFPSSYRLLDIEELHVYGHLGKFEAPVEILTRNKIGLFYEVIMDEELENSGGFKQLLDLLEYGKLAFDPIFFKKIRVNFNLGQGKLREKMELVLEYISKLKAIDSRIELGVSLPLFHPDYNFKSRADEKYYLEKLLPQVNFLSFRSDPNDVYEHNKDMILDMEVFNEYVYKESLKLKEVLSKNGIDLPLVLTEWNTLTGEKQNINGIFFRAAIILQEILKLDLHIDSYGFWLNAGLYQKFKLNKSSEYNGLELFHNYSGKKPVYQVLSLSSRLKGNILFLGKETMLLNDEEDYQLLMWNPNYFNPKLSKVNKFLESQAVSYNIEVPAIAKGYYQVKRFDLNRYFGALYYEFKDFQTKYPIDLESHNYIFSKCMPKLSYFDVRVEDGFKFNCILDTNAITLLEFKQIG